MDSKKPWSGRFAADTDHRVEGFTSSLAFDRRLYKQDIAGSIAHCQMLVRCGLLTAEEGRQIVEGLREIQQEIEAGTFPFRIEYEDIHMNIERRLIEKIGPVGGKLHTARSRNDQVTLDLRLYLREKIGDLSRQITLLQQTFLELAEQHLDQILPGYTHLQRAQPVLLAHHFLAYYEMLERDKGRLQDCLRRLNVLPLGAAALAGTSYPIDRAYVAEQLDFPCLSQNSMDAVSDRDYVVEFCAAGALLMLHLSRLCEELVLWSSAEFGFIELSDAVTTGSSIMPQKKNPDVAELIRGKTGRVYGNLMTILTVMKGLPLTYDGDMQEDKEAVFDTVDTLEACLRVLPVVLRQMEVKGERMRAAAAEGFTNATDMADYLVRQGIPFREAHRIVGQVVRYCLEQGKTLEDLTLEELHRFSPRFEPEILDQIRLEVVVDNKQVVGGTARNQVKRRIQELKARMES
ncbi:MAG: argininosuccinate lyase [Nitrospinota bacterium]|nr:MAG: argininosuccinate lyase [Nitrospinota bacterium]